MKYKKQNVINYGLNLLKATSITLLALTFAAGIAYGVDRFITAPSGKLILDSQSTVEINKPLTAQSISGPGSVPIGGMVAVMPQTHANARKPPENCLTIKDGFMRAGYSGSACVVPTCADCIIPAGTTLPNMNNDVYARGNDTSGGSGGANTEASNVTVGNHTFTNPYVPKHYHWEGNHSTGLTADAHTHTADGTLATTSATSVASSAHTHARGTLQAEINTSGSQNKLYANYETSPGLEFHHSGPITITAHTPSVAWSYATPVRGSTAANTSLTSLNNIDIDGSTGGADASGVTGYVGENESGSCNGDESNTCQTTGGSVSIHSVTNNAVNNEPKYLSVVWVIRVK